MNRYLTYQEGELLFEDVALSEIAQEMYTPFFVYSKAAILEKVEAFKQAFADVKPMMAYSMKALDTTLILKMLQERGCGVGVSNLYELRRALAAGFQPTSIVFNSNGLADYEIPDILKHRPLVINVGNLFELEPLNRFAAELDSGVRIGLRLNLGIDTGGFTGTNTGACDSRVGIQRSELDLALALISKFSQLNLVGIACHCGSQIAQLAPWIKMSEEMARIYKDIRQRGFNLEYLDLGGGYPVGYGRMDYLEIKKIARNIVPHIKDLDCRVILEPGRYFTAEAGVLVTSVLGVKDIGQKFYVVCDAGFAELPRPAMYRLSHEIIPLKEPKACKPKPEGAFAVEGAPSEPTEVATAPTTPDPGEFLRRFDLPEDLIQRFRIAEQFGTARPPGESVKADVIGPGDEGLDYLAHDIDICIPKRGDMLAVLNVGAYGRTMSSNYASRLRPPEILIERDKFETIRAREFLEDLTSCDLEESEVDS